jgi:hypothetical protein
MVDFLFNFTTKLFDTNPPKLWPINTIGWCHLYLHKTYSFAKLNFEVWLQFLFLFSFLHPPSYIYSLFMGRGCALNFFLNLFYFGGGDGVQVNAFFFVLHLTCGRSRGRGLSFSSKKNFIVEWFRRGGFVFLSFSFFILFFFLFLLDFFWGHISQF